MLIYVTGLTQVPKDVLEASQIDGANAVTTLFKIKIPMIAATITICTFLTLTSAFKQFDVNMALTNGTGSVASFFGNYLTNGTDAGSEYLQYSNLQEQLCTWSGESYSVLHYPGCCIYYSG